MRSVFLKTSLIVIVVLLCVGLPIVKAEGDGVVSWTSPTAWNLYSVSMVSADDGWAVGDLGAIVRWNGTDWNNIITPSIINSDPLLYSVFMVSADDGWAVGEYSWHGDIHGNIIHWNGTSWNRVASPIVSVLSSVFMVSADDGWAVGARQIWVEEDGVYSYPGLIIRWNGSSWTNVTSPTNSRLYSVFMVSADDGWAVGTGGTIIRWNGTSWNNVTSPTTSRLNSVFMVSADDGWAVGGTPGHGDIHENIIHWNGTSWNNVTSPTTSGLYSVFMVSADDGWAVGYRYITSIGLNYPGVIVHWDGTSWTNVPRSPEIYGLTSVFMVGPDDGWAVGYAGTIQRWTGTEWIPEFPSTALVPVFICLTLAAIIVAKAAPKKCRRSTSPSKTQL